MIRFRRRRQDVTPPEGRRWLQRMRAAALYALVGLAAFVLGGYLFFPAAPLKERLSYEVARRSSARLAIGNLALRLPLRLEADELMLITPQLQPELRIERVRIAPLWLSLFSGNPGFGVEARLLGGGVEAALYRDGRFAGSGSGLALRLPLPQPSSLAFSGTLRAATVSGEAPLRPTTASRAELTLENVSLTGLQAFGSARDELSLGTLTLLAGGQGQNLRIEKLLARGGDLEAEGNGSLLLATPLERSRLKLTLTLKPAAGLDPALRDLLGALSEPGADGALQLRLGGALSAPSLQ